MVKLLTKELAKIDSVGTNPIPIVTLGLVPVGVKIQPVVPVNKIVPGPLTPLVVVPEFAKFPLLLVSYYYL
jgi:hypothetical protein